jgi:hypothetical protein
MGPKKTSPVKDAKVAKTTPTKKAAAKTPTTKAAAAAKTPPKKAAKAKAGTEPQRKYIKVGCGGIDRNAAQDFATFTWSLYLEGSNGPIAVVEGAMPHKDDAFWCGQTGPVFGMDLEAMGKDGHRFVWKY